MQEVFEGTTAVITINVIDSGAHVAANIDTATTRLSNHASAVPTVTNPSTGVYKIKFSGLSPALSVSDNDDGVSCAVNGDIGGTAWSEYHVPIKVAATMRGTDSASTHSASDIWQHDISLYDGLSDIFAGHVLKDIETAVNSGGSSAPSAADIYAHFTSGSNEDAFKADVSGLSTFDHTTDQVVASNMRGTDGANTVAPDNASIASILADTNELQQNQGDWATATGFSTHSAADVVTALQAVANDFKADITALASQASVDTIDSIVDAIKAKTDQLAFTVAGQVDANALTGGGGATAAEVYSEFTSGSNADAFKANVSGLATQTSVDSIDTDVQNIGSDVSAILTDTNELQLNQGDWATATGFSTFDHTTDQVVASNMRGTDGANTVAPDNASITAILADTNELQLNQGDWATATGFSTHSSSDVVSGLQAVSGDFKADVSSLLTTTAYSASLPANFGDLLIGTGADLGKVTTSNPAAGSGSSHTAADVAALILETPANKLVTNASGQVEASNMRGTDGANTVAPVDVSADVAAILADTNELQQNQNNWLTATGFSTHSAGDIWDQAHASHTTDGTFGAHLLISTNQNHEVQITGSNHIAADVHEFQTNSLTADATDATFVAEVSSGGGGDDAATIYSYFTDGSREDVFKADVSNLSTDAPTAQEIYDLFTSGSNEDVFKADVSNISTDSPTAQEIYDLFVSGSNEDAFKADVSALATSAELAQLSSGGTGLNQITVRVQDSNGDALQGAVVNIDNTVLSLVTTPTGEVVFNLDNSTYDFDVSPPAGYDTPASQQLVVNGDSTIIFTLTGSSSGGGGDVAWVG